MESQTDLEQWSAKLEGISFGPNPHFATVQCLPSLCTTRRILTELARLSKSAAREHRPRVEDTLFIYVAPDRRTAQFLKHEDCNCDAEWGILSAQEVCQKLKCGDQWKPESGGTYRSITVIFDAAYISTTPHMIAASAGLLRFMAQSFSAKLLSCCTAVALTDGQRPFFPTDEELIEAFGVHATVTYHKLIQNQPTVLRSPLNKVRGNAEIILRHVLLHDDDVDLALTQKPRLSTQRKTIVCLADSDTADTIANAMYNDNDVLRVRQYATKQMRGYSLRICIVTQENLERHLRACFVYTDNTPENERHAILFIDPDIRFVLPFPATIAKHFAVLRNNLHVFDREVQQVTRKLVGVSQVELNLAATFGLVINTPNSRSVTILDEDASFANIPESPLSVSSAWARDPMTTLFLLVSVDPTRPVEQYLTVVAQQACADPQLTRELLMRLVHRRLITHRKLGFGQEVAYDLTELGRGVLQFLHGSSTLMSLADAMYLYHTSAMQSVAVKSTLAVMRCVLRLDLSRFLGGPGNTLKSFLVHPLLAEPWKSMCYKGPLWAALGLLVLALGRGANPTTDCLIPELGGFKIRSTYVRAFTMALRSTCETVGLPDIYVSSWVNSNLTPADIRAVEKVLVASEIDCVAVAQDLSQAGPVIEAYDLVAPVRLHLGSYDTTWFKPFPNQPPKVDQRYTTFFVHLPYRLQQSDIPCRPKGKLATLVSSSVVHEVLSEQEGKEAE
ncbi:uncharacterized protein B0T23DRAFT_425803 [Neurospora hispaniola]|uniref:Uncharacterized protein n=1 Tax=Neurospora hispaniola TaxID=588809 RepID=A0AAJ0MWK2_9PEZI|nr:hypothetical protein B0T23DRAFT_425803 [Neurospora hispaniola]